MYSLNPNKIDRYNEIDRGSFGEVYPYKKTPEDERFVTKCAYVHDSPKLLGYIQQIVLGFSCRHDNVLPVLGYHIDYDIKKKGWRVYIKLDRMECSLKSKIREQQDKGRYFSQKYIVNYLYEISCGIEYLHKRGIAHRAIKPSNVLISKNEEIKITDIGLGTSLGTTPETLQKEDAHHLKKKDLFKADIWDLGVVIAELCLLELEIVDITMSRSENEDNIIQKLKPLEGKIYDKGLLDLIVSLLRSDPTQIRLLQDIQKTLREKFGNDLEVKKNNFNNYKCKNHIGVQNKGISLANKNEEVKIEILPSVSQLIEKNLKDFNKKLKDSYKINFETKSGNFKAKIEPTNCEEITDNKVKELAQLIGSSLKNIQDLSLDLFNCRKITDNGIKELAQQIGSNLKNIQCFSLNLRNCHYITDNGVKRLAQQIGSNIKNVQTLFLNFNSCKKITDDGVKELAQQIGSNFKNIQHLSLDFFL